MCVPIGQRGIVIVWFWGLPFAVWHTAQLLNRCDTPQAFSLIIFLYLKGSLTVTKNVQSFSRGALLMPHILSFSLFSALFPPFTVNIYLSVLCPLSLKSFSSSLLFLFPCHSSPLFSSIYMSIYRSNVLQYPRLPTARLCSQPDRGSSQQYGALGLRQGVQADWKGHSCVQEDHLQLLRLGCSSSRMSRWAQWPWKIFISNFSRALSVSSGHCHYIPLLSRQTCRCLKLPSVSGQTLFLCC